MSYNNISSKYIPKFSSIFIPILVQYFFQTLLGNADTLILSKYSDSAVAAVGLSNQIMVIGTMILGIVEIGTSIILVQLSTKANDEKTEGVIRGSIYLNLIISLMLFVILVFFGRTFLKWIQVPEELIEMAYVYLKIVGFSLIFQGVMSSFTAIFRSFAFIKAIMNISIFINILNIIGNSIVILTPLTFLGQGIEGVANSTLISRVVGVVIYIYLFTRQFSQYGLKIFKPSLEVNSLKAIFKLGLPSGMESVSYNVSQTILIGIIAGLGTVMVTSKIYAQIMTSFIFTISASISIAVQIIIGKLIGIDLKEEALKYGLNIMYKGATLVFALSLVMAVLSNWIAEEFTKNSSIIKIVVLLVFLSVLLEPARAVNSIFIANLNAAGDVKYPVIVGVIVTYLVTIPMSYLVGIKLGGGITGIWIVSIIDEWLRATVFYIRWKKGKWKEINILS